MEITREIQIDAGHRIPNHKAKCRHVHGHRYRIVATVEGDLVSDSGESEEGMVMDFGDLKEIMMRRIHEPLDHGFIVWKGDELIRTFLEQNEFRVIVFDDIPTAENLAKWCYDEMTDEVNRAFKRALRLKSITVWETPNNSATWHG